jgi:hypothetical protein
LPERFRHERHLPDAATEARGRTHARAPSAPRLGPLPGHFEPAFTDSKYQSASSFHTNRRAASAYSFNRSPA